jgi:DNA-binding NarL/FixJ family response regulator
MTAILCVEPSASYRALVSRLAVEAGVDTTIFHEAKNAFDYLNSQQPCALMIVADQLDGAESGVNLIRSARLLASRATMPILFVMTERDADLALSAMQAGSTEIVLRSDSALLDSLIHEYTNPLQEFPQTGRALLVEDSDSQAAYVEQLCVALGLGVDRCVSMEEGVERLKKGDYQIAIIDIVLQGMGSGLSLVRHIRQLPSPRSRLPVLVMSGFNDVARRIEALRIGADDFLNKPFAEEEFVWRLRRIIQARSTNGHETPNSPSPELLTWQKRGLSLRESEICKALIQGVNDKQIAADLHISFWTVRTHISSIFTKLGVINRRELMARYLPGLGNNR